MSTVNPSSEPVNYGSSNTPSSYICGGCGMSQVKLWRGVHSAGASQLRCANCASKLTGVSVQDIDANGTCAGEFGRTSAIGDLVPAIPTEENDTFWTDAPLAGWQWWARLPNCRAS